jgi:hypothetical protein
VIAAFTNFWTQTKQLWTAGTTYISTKWDEIVATAQSIPGRVYSFFSNLWTQIVGLWDQGVAYVVNKWNEIVTGVQNLPDNISQFLAALWQTIQGLWDQGVAYISQKWDEAISFLKSKATDFISFFSGWYNRIAGFFNDLISKARTFLGLTGASGGGVGGATVSAAGGGLIRGPGTGTSDSILGWLSNREYVMTARAVRKYGVGFMNAINSLKFSPDMLAGFASGGLVTVAPSPVPVASGASNTGFGRPIFLQIGEESFALQSRDDDTANRLVRFATKRQLASAGRAPSWKR